MTSRAATGWMQLALRSASFVIALAASWSARAADLASVRTQAVEVVYHLADGTYDVVALPSGQPIVAGAHSEMGPWKSTDPGWTRQAEVTRGTDELGTVQRLVVRCTAEGRPTLIAAFDVHQETASAVILRSGLENSTSDAIRVHGFFPLRGGVISPGAPRTDVRMLNGDSACAPMQVTRDTFRSSANNLLLTFKQAAQRRSLVLGGLAVADFTRWARTTAPGGHDARWSSLNESLPGARLISRLDATLRESSEAMAGGPRIAVLSGQPFTYPATGADSARQATVLFGDRQVEFHVGGLDPQKHYALGFSWWDFDGNGRVESVAVQGAGQTERVLMAKHPLPRFQEKRQGPEELAMTLPPASYENGSLSVRFSSDVPGVNAVVSEIWLWEFQGESVVPPDWAAGRTISTEAPSEHPDTTGPVLAELEASDPVGRLVEAGETYLPEDSFYLDGGTPDPFAALEVYGRRLALANHAQPHLYDFPTICAWYAGVWHTPGAQDHPDKSRFRINTTPGLVEEMDQLGAAGLLRYSRFAGRLVPDNYQVLNPQGWWDDDHWRRFGYYVPPFETSEKFGRAMHERGGLAFIYIQPACLWPGAQMSQDFREAHTDWLCGHDVKHTLDFTNPQARQYLRKTFGALGGSIDGLMVDYCDHLWLSEAAKGGFSDPHTTSTAFYRTFFRIVKDGMGANSWLHERNLEQPDNDLTIGIVDSQRTSQDTDKISPELVARSGLRWYKNRVVLNYDMDSKDLNGSWKVPGYNGSDRDGRRMTLTMAAVAASRLLLADSVRDLSPEARHDLSRTFPYPGERQSARPLDAFMRDGAPGVYDLGVNPRWHQLVLCNNTLPTKDARFSIPMSGDPVEGALGLDAGKAYYVYDFWNDRFAGWVDGSAKLEQSLRPGEARMLAIHEVEPTPQFISTNRHILQGVVDLDGPPVWDGTTRTLRGISKVVGGETYEIVVALNGSQPDRATASNAEIHIEPFPNEQSLVRLKIDASQNATVEWNLHCR